MLDSIFIDNFRLFKRLDLQRLGRVNLIVGKNHSGKSTLLEAVRLYASNVALDVLIDLVASRQELQSGQAWSPRSNGHGDSFRHLFYGHNLPSFSEDGIRLGTARDPEHQVHIRPAAYHRETVEGGGVVSHRIDPADYPGDPADLQGFLVVEESSGTRRLIRLDEEPRRALRRSYLPGRKIHEPSCRVLQVGVQGTSMDELASMWDATSLTDLEGEVIAGLQLIEPGIRGIAFIDAEEAPRGNRRIPMVKQKGLKERLPLKTMGDGILRLFHVALALVNAQGGVLLIDEMENGLHWSVQPRVWALVFQLAEKLNVQVFATTHSKDCVRGFEIAWTEYPMMGAFFRLDCGADGVAVTPYNLETLSDSLETAVEIR